MQDAFYLYPAALAKMQQDSFMTVHNPNMPVVFPHGFQITADLIELSLIHTFAIILYDDLQYLAFLTNLDPQPELPILQIHAPGCFPPSAE